MLRLGRAVGAGWWMGLLMVQLLHEPGQGLHLDFVGVRVEGDGGFVEQNHWGVDEMGLGHPDRWRWPPDGPTARAEVCVSGPLCPARAGESRRGFSEEA